MCKAAILLHYQNRKTMSAKETIALIGNVNKNQVNFLLKSIAGFRILLIAQEEESIKGFSENILNYDSNTEIETLTCAKEGCWEADIIFLLDASLTKHELIDKIKQVATQKIVVLLELNHNSEISITQCNESLQQLLPNSKVLQLKKNTTTGEIHLHGKDKESLIYIQRLLEKTGNIVSLIQEG